MLRGMRTIRTYGYDARAKLDMKLITFRTLCSTFLHGGGGEVEKEV